MRYLPADIIPSPAAHCARRSRVNASLKAATAFRARRDYYYPAGGGLALYAAFTAMQRGFHTFDRPRDCLYPNAGRDVRYIGSNGHA